MMHPCHHCHHCHHCRHHDYDQVAPEVRQFPLPDGADYTEVLTNTTIILMKMTKHSHHELNEDHHNDRDHDQDEHVDDLNGQEINF